MTIIYLSFSWSDVTTTLCPYYGGGQACWHQPSIKGMLINHPAPSRDAASESAINGVSASLALTRPEWIWSRGETGGRWGLSSLLSLSLQKCNCEEENGVH